MYDASRVPAATTRTTSPTDRSRPDATNTMAPTYASPNTAHATACHSAVARLAAATGPYQRSHAARRSRTSQSPVPVTLTSLPGGADVPRTNRWRPRRVFETTDSSTARSTAGRHVDVIRAGTGEQRQDHQCGVNGTQQHDGDHQSEHPAERGEQRQEHVVEGEDLLAQHRQPVEVVGPLVVLDGGHRRLQPRDVGFEHDGDAVAEPSLHALRQHAEVPGRCHRGRQAQRGDDDGGTSAVVGADRCRRPAASATAPAARRAASSAVPGRAPGTATSARPARRCGTCATTPRARRASGTPSVGTVPVDGDSVAASERLMDHLLAALVVLGESRRLQVEHRVDSDRPARSAHRAIRPRRLARPR